MENIKKILNTQQIEVRPKIFKNHLKSEFDNLFIYSFLLLFN